ncbi:glycosyltransferase family 2 protein [Cohnella terricola]|uniref:Glycosyltransferase n=1 Tax=Cohnella terricola TaxID=1289167 RepID=A0A559JB39_9BACL|nr:glycosyltransferase family 2 protein [Cohnella terricola]TVX97071.1 glycosyltransferase [Cohnella terricola]
MVLEKEVDAVLVTVVTPSYNQGRFIKETIESVLTQDYPNIEYIIVDGGSTDETIEILKSYGERIRWISENDEGQADAVNKGISMARGEVIGWLNSDDTYLPGAISKVANEFNLNSGIDMVYGEGYHISEHGDILDRYPTEKYDWEKLAQTCFICQPTAFIRKNVIENLGGLNKNLQLCMDYDLWIRIGQTYEIKYISEYLATSRLYESNKTLSRTDEVYSEAVTTVKKYYGFVPLTWVYGYVYNSSAYKSSKGLTRLKFYALLKFITINRRHPVLCIKQLMASFLKKMLQLR